MKIAVAQVCPTIGPIAPNVDRHLVFAELAARQNVQLVVFPELSLTGYEPSLAKEWACSVNDPGLAEFQHHSNHHNLSIAVGLPLQTDDKPGISTITFRPDLPPVVYTKRFLHADETPWFFPGKNADSWICCDPKVALAICYELTVPEHAANAFHDGATAYIASVAKTEAGMQAARKRLSKIAAQHSALVMVSNSVGTQDSVLCSGGSAAWDRNGRLIAELDSTTEGILIVDDQTLEAETINVQNRPNA